MSEFQQIKNQRKWYHSTLFLLFVFVFSIVFIFSIMSLVRKNRETAIAKEAARNELQSLEERQKKLEQDIKGLSTDKGIEKNIRQQFQVAKDGEGVVVIVTDHADKTSSGTTPEKKSFLEKVFSSDTQASAINASH